MDQNTKLNPAALRELMEMARNSVDLRQKLTSLPPHLLVRLCEEVEKFWGTCGFLF